MSAKIRAWLPPGAATGRRVRDALEGGLDAWARKWFPDARLSLAAIEPHGAGAPRLGHGWLLHGEAVAVPADPPETLRLAGAALGADPENLVLAEPDRDILGRFAQTMLNDLAVSVALALGRDATAEAEPRAVADPLDGDAGITAHVTDARGRPLTQVAISLAALAPFIRTAVQPRKAPGLPPLDSAVRRTTARLDVRLGACRLNLGDLTGLTAGDVLILDRTVEAGARISLAGDRVIARAALAAHDEGTLLTLAPEDGIK